ncbi:hypothetical protein EYC84_010732 [Monilinia fructicola]|uniref:SH3 domain-containing protein n=1 Tax=Monilinia fructicola TaxID=38448 RepID=A0A5M9J9F9_MONFR|nr:hypothetical protein EYC84_010732 [Monilinia fructicola]
MEHPKTMESHHAPGARRPEPGATLIVIHDFSARSSDELSLSKGDRVELIERDDEFGDGWYLGRSLVNGSSGLFPEVYTRLAPRGSPSHPNLSAAAMSQTGALQIPSAQQSLNQSTAQRSSGETATTLLGTSEPTPDSLSTSQPSSFVASVEPPTNAAAKAIPPLSAASVSSAAKSHAHGQDSPVMNETLSVIDEHITDMNHIVGSVPKSINDSGSEYSSHHPDARLSYINGEETDEEEEEEAHTLEEVTIWTPEQVAEYLFTVGVEKKHCEVFRDQEITGDVLLNMDQTSVFLKEFELGSVGRRLKTWQKIKALQDEVNGDTLTRRNTATYGSEMGSEDGGRRSRSGTSPLSSNRPLSSAGLTEITTADQAPEIRAPNTNLEADRGYFSGGELEGRQRNVLRKRGSTASHSRKSSYTDEQRLRTATTNSRHSRFGSVDSVREAAPPTAAQKYYGLSVNGRRRTPSESSSINSPPRPVPPPKDDFPLVTRLQPEKSMDSIMSPKSPKSPSLRQGPSDWLLPVKPAGSSSHFSMRAISDAVTGREKSRITSPTETVSSSTKESPLQSPSRTGSSTPSGGPSFELDPPDDKMAMVAPKTSRKKSKKETSAYTRGLEKKTRLRSKWLVQITVDG